jgi:hypothetical protein
MQHHGTSHLDPSAVLALCSYLSNYIISYSWFCIDHWDWWHANQVHLGSNQPLICTTRTIAQILQNNFLARDITGTLTLLYGVPHNMEPDQRFSPYRWTGGCGSFALDPWPTILRAVGIACLLPRPDAFPVPKRSFGKPGCLLSVVSSSGLSSNIVAGQLVGWSTTMELLPVYLFKMTLSRWAYPLVHFLSWSLIGKLSVHKHHTFRTIN